MNIIYTRPDDNGLSIVIPSTKQAIEEKLGPLTQEQYESHIWAASVPSNAINPRKVSVEDIPQSREFRDAWEDVGEKITVNLSKAKDIQLQKIRSYRDLLLKEKYDGLLNRAMEIGTEEEVAEIKRKKQELRDATNSLKSLDPKTLQEIKDCTPHHIFQEVVQ